MREIKFRGYGIRGKEWHYGFVYNYVTCRNGVAVEHYAIQLKESKEKLIMDNYMFEVEEASIGQYTGFKDSYGTEIYEGDILEVIEDEEISNYKVYYSEELGEWCNYCKIFGVNVELYRIVEFETKVIGNIYEEKLKNEDK